LLTQRVNGKVQTEHIAALGSIDAAMSVGERLAFWAKLPERLARLGNRVGPNDQAKIYAALNNRIPMVTSDEQRAAQEEYFTDEVQIAETIRDMAEGSVVGHKRVVAKAEDAIAKAALVVASFAADAANARERLAKLKRGESVSGGLGKRPDVLAMFKAAGWTPREIRRARRLASLTDEEFDTLRKRIDVATNAADEAIDREARRIIHGRSWAA
jgi:hypothetical protein